MRFIVLVSLCVRPYMCVCVCVCFHVFWGNNSKRNQSRSMKFKYIVVYENNSNKFDTGHCRTKVKVTANTEIFLHLLQYKLSGPITQLWYKLRC